MEDTSIITPDLDEIRLLLEKQAENFQRLHVIISGITGEHMIQLRKALTERLSSMEEVEQHIWKELFPHSASEYAAEHRMTMTHRPHSEDYY